MIYQSTRGPALWAGVLTAPLILPKYSWIGGIFHQVSADTWRNHQRIPGYNQVAYKWTIIVSCIICKFELEPGSSHAWLLLEHPETQAVSAWQVTVPSDPAVNHGSPGTGYYGITRATGGYMIIHHWLNECDTSEMIWIDIDIYILWHCLDFDTKMSRKEGGTFAQQATLRLKNEK